VVTEEGVAAAEDGATAVFLPVEQAIIIPARSSIYGLFFIRYILLTLKYIGNQCFKQRAKSSKEHAFYGNGFFR
jgi:hypothetical protein